MYLADIYTVTANLAGICGISVPCGNSSAGLPIGAQILGRHFDEATVRRCRPLPWRQSASDEHPLCDSDRILRAKIAVVALDVPSAAQARELAAQLRGTCRWVKVGLELYLAAGTAIVEELTAQDFSVFLDLKFHDIPNTVAGAVRSAASMGASLLTIHAAGGPAMLRAAAEAAAATKNAPQLLAVTVLTSMDRAQLSAIGIDRTAADQECFAWRALTIDSGIRGLVCSPEEVALLPAGNWARNQAGYPPAFARRGLLSATKNALPPQRMRFARGPANSLWAGLLPRRRIQRRRRNPSWTKSPARSRTRLLQCCRSW